MSSPFGVFSKAEETRKRTVPDRVLILRMYDYAKPYRRNLAVGAITIVLTALTGLLSPYLHKVAIDQIIQPGNLIGFLWWVPLFILVTLANFFFQYIQLFQMRIVGEKVVARMRDEMIHKLQIISLRYFSEGEIGRILSRPVNDANTVRIFLRMGLTSIIQDTASILGALIIIFSLNVKLALLAVAVLPFAVTLAWLLGKVSRAAYRDMLSTLGGLTSRIQENLSGMKVIKSFVQEENALEEFSTVQDKTVKASLRTIRISAAYQPIILYLRIAGTALILWYGSLMVLGGEITVGTLVAFIEYQFSYFMPLVDLVSVYDQYQSAMAAIERMFDLIDTNVEVGEAPPEEAIEISSIEEVTFENVTFGYDPRIPVVKNVSFSLKKPYKLAIVGPTGAGKSTIINLLARFYDPLEGRILINGYDLRKIKISSLRDKMKIVLQDSFLFPMSVKDNIRFGNPEASDEEVVEAAKAVGAHEFIMKLPGGYDYIIQEGSSNISIGQRQLISFARTLLMNPQLLILDEATSSIDPYTELVVQNALKKLLENRLAIIIAHRLSTIRLCNEIIVLDQGRVVERGTHKELMEKGGIYSAFYRMQFKEEKGLEIAARIG
ncbi:MAG: ABC transporter ATP-binding protein [Nitrososphaerota archaeon]|nr:ABC transporter ATP-binding protein/permease [Candidatus Bathyarchaeota archaeon]MDW8048117.1 ABC transporter ATP-binding protein [Nitrososphaerota archaeon]